MRGILFDLDGTLLDIDLDDFLQRYFGALSETVAKIVPDENAVPKAMEALMEATSMMMQPHPGETNQQVFHRDWKESTGIDLDEHWDLFEKFYDERFPLLGDGMGPHPGAHESLKTARECGLKIAIATNPIFPLKAVKGRMAWAGIDPTQVDVITSYENMYASKPHLEYFRQTAKMIDVDPSDCLMVGDDPGLDLPASDTGMRTYYVGDARNTSADYSGPLTALPDLLRRTCLEK